ncbi:MAG: 16S rRNA (guanine(527)-N(7))-methyltransferase RsmG [Candidatus Sumerlaeia bacterium]|nr:16S rRNA (guanine(527)-N(7))-methyltransferase RsmG [Candidatus Sumerlaeia bacterium]
MATSELQSVLLDVVEPFTASLNGSKDAFLNKCEVFLEMLRSRGRDNNLTGFRDSSELAIQVVGDSLAPILEAPKAIRDFGPDELLDVGSGAGLPGIIYALYWTDCDVTLLESNKKRIEFLEEVIAALELDNCKILEGRAETHAHELKWRERFDLVTSRAVAPLPIALELCLPYLALEGYMLTFKGSNPAEEIKDAEFALSKLGGGSVEVRSYHAAPTESKRNALWIKKVGLTPDRYPRREGIPAKRPLRGSRS